MSIARCDDCGSLIDIDDDPAAATEEGRFVCAWDRGEETYGQAVARQRALYERLRARTPTYDVNRRTYG